MTRLPLPLPPPDRLRGCPTAVVEALVPALMDRWLRAEFGVAPARDPSWMRWFSLGRAFPAAPHLDTRALIEESYRR